MSVKSLKKGDKVVMHTCMEAKHYDGQIWTCKTDEQKLYESHNFTVVWLEGFSGSFDAKYLQKVNLPTLGDVDPHILTNGELEGEGEDYIYCPNCGMVKND